jgi:hypothetical protein
VRCRLRLTHYQNMQLCRQCAGRTSHLALLSTLTCSVRYRLQVYQFLATNSTTILIALLLWSLATSPAALAPRVALFRTSLRSKSSIDFPAAMALTLQKRATVFLSLVSQLEASVPMLALCSVPPNTSRAFSLESQQQSSVGCRGTRCRSFKRVAQYVGTCINRVSLRTGKSSYF